MLLGQISSEPFLRTAATDDNGTANESHNSADGPQYALLSMEKRALSANPAVAVADCIHVPLRSGSCDAAICIAVMHHLSTEGRRIRCLSELRRIVKVGGMSNVQRPSVGARSRRQQQSQVPRDGRPRTIQCSTEASQDAKQAE